MPGIGLAGEMSMRDARMLALLLSLVLPAAAATALELGDPAPPLKIAQWIQGEPIHLKDGVGKHVYVIEFWATWCPPCVASVPHLTELQAKHKKDGVVIVNTSETPGKIRKMQLSKSMLPGS